jgi:hypothetical protein
MNAEEFVSLIAKLNKTDKPFSLGTIGSVSGGKATIQFDGESSPSSKYYHTLTSYSPVAGRRVLLANVAGTHIIIGEISPQP